MQHFGKTIREMRTSKGMSQAALARACKITPVSVNDWESGKTQMIDGWNLISAAAALNVAPEAILGRHVMRADFSAREATKIYYAEGAAEKLYLSARAALDSGAISPEYLASLSAMIETLKNEHEISQAAIKAAVPEPNPPAP